MQEKENQDIVKRHNTRQDYSISEPESPKRLGATTRLAGKVAMITGGATGLGRSTAELFAKEGAKVIVTTRNKVIQGTALADSIKQEGGEAIFVQLDVRDEDCWRYSIKEVISKYGKLNILVNNAGVAMGKNIEECSLDEWNMVMDVNSTGVFLGMKHAIEAMKSNGELCSIINISSIDGIVGEPELAAYCASKGAIRLLTKSVALYCGMKGYHIRVNSVHPGFIRTELTEKEGLDRGLTLEQYFEEAVRMHPIGYLGQPTDVAFVNLYLASDESKWVTGSEFVIDGGYTAK
ncbi:MAG: glucose 1-dehydrogenase [Chloroflexi bacterium]|nr:glucose 1-dehydrogenase [Chloroflexota bacterium]